MLLLPSADLCNSCKHYSTNVIAVYFSNTDIYVAGFFLSSRAVCPSTFYFQLLFFISASNVTLSVVHIRSVSVLSSLKQLLSPCTQHSSAELMECRLLFSARVCWCHPPAKDIWYRMCCSEGRPVEGTNKHARAERRPHNGAQQLQRG